MKDSMPMMVKEDNVGAKVDLQTQRANT